MLHEKYSGRAGFREFLSPQAYTEGVSEAVIDDCLEEDVPKPCIIKALTKQAALVASVEVVVTEHGPLGMALASEHEDDLPFVHELVEGGQMSQHPEVKVGMMILTVDGQAVSSYDQCMQLLVAAGRPVRLQFSVAPQEADEADEAGEEDEADAELENLRTSSKMAVKAPAVKQPKDEQVANSVKLGTYWLQCSKADNYTGCFGDHSTLPSTEFGPDVEVDKLTSVDMLARWYTHDEYLMPWGMSAEGELAQYHNMKSQKCSDTYKCFRGSYSKEWYGASLSGNNPLRINEMCAGIKILSTTQLECTNCFEPRCIVRQ